MKHIVATKGGLVPCAVCNMLNVISRKRSIIAVDNNVVSFCY